jgi:hypothetical protein
MATGRSGRQSGGTPLLYVARLLEITRPGGVRRRRFVSVWPRPGPIHRTPHVTCSKCASGCRWYSGLSGVSRPDDGLILTRGTAPDHRNQSSVPVIVDVLLVLVGGTQRRSWSAGTTTSCRTHGDDRGPGWLYWQTTCLAHERDDLAQDRRSTGYDALCSSRQPTTSWIRRLPSH